MTIARTILPEPCTVLLVEDYYANILVATTLLEQYGYTVDIAKSGFEALDKFRENRYSAILMDVQMQEMDGLETTRRIREQEATLTLPRTPIIAMTAHVLDQHRRGCIEAGMDDFLPKPYKPQMLQEVLARHTTALAS